jgi:hypothetical protein
MRSTHSIRGTAIPLNHGRTMKPTEQSFQKDQLERGKFADFDYLPMWHYLDNLDKKYADKGGIGGIKLEEVFKGIYEFAVISVGLDKGDMQSRIDLLNEQNLKWFTRADTLQAENEQLKQKLLESQSTKES